MIDFFVYWVPWWGLLILGLIGLAVLVYLSRNLKQVLVAGIGVLGVVLYLKARQAGYKDHEEKVKEYGKELQDEYDRIEADEPTDRDNTYDGM